MQQLPATIEAISGYLEHPDASTPPAFPSTGDLVHYYLIPEMTAGQTISVKSYNSDMSTLITLWNTEGEAIQQYSASLDSINTLTVQANGDYLLGIETTHGKGNYLAALNTQNNTLINAKSTIISSEDDFSTDTLLAQSAATINSAQTAPHLFSIKDIVWPNASSDYLSRLDKFIASEQLEKWKTTRTIIRFNKLEYIERAEPDFFNETNTLFTIPNVPDYISQWALDAINSPTAWRYTEGEVSETDSIIVAVLDTGVYSQHPDIKNHGLRIRHDCKPGSL